MLLTPVSHCLPKWVTVKVAHTAGCLRRLVPIPPLIQPQEQMDAAWKGQQLKQNILEMPPFLYPFQVPGFSFSPLLDSCQFQKHLWNLFWYSLLILFKICMKRVISPPPDVWKPGPRGNKYFLFLRMDRSGLTERPMRPYGESSLHCKEAAPCGIENSVVASPCGKITLK